MTVLRFLKNVFRPRDEWVYVLLGIFLLVIATNTQTGWLYVVVAFLVALLMVGFVGPRLTLRGLEVTRFIVPPAWEGDTVTMRLRVRNPTRWPRFVVTVAESPPFAPADAPPRTFVIGTIPPHGGITVEYPLDCAFRGAQPFSDTTLGSATPLGLFPATRVSRTPGELVVYPRGPEMRRMDLLSVTPRAASSNRSFHRAGHSYDFQGIREYQFGDDIRFVHWATTARTGQLMLREFRELGAQHLTVLIDDGAASAGGPAGATPLDDAARIGAAIVMHASKSAANVTLVCAGDSRPTILHQARGPQALDWLARLTSRPDASWVDVALTASAVLPGQGRLIVLAASPLQEADLERLLEMRLQLVVIQLENYAEGTVSPEAWQTSARLLAKIGATVRRHRAEVELSRTLMDADTVSR